MRWPRSPENRVWLLLVDGRGPRTQGPVRSPGHARADDLDQACTPLVSPADSQWACPMVVYPLAGRSAGPASFPMRNSETPHHPVAGRAAAAWRARWRTPSVFCRCIRWASLT